MKVSSPFLHELIGSMTASEKRHFKLYMALHKKKKGNKGILLFNEIASQKKYDEAKLKVKFQHDQFLKKHLNKAKLDLHDSILKCLRIFYENKTRANKLIHAIQNAEILYGKGLYKQAMKIWEKNRRIAFEEEHYWLYFKLVNDEIRFHHSLSFTYMSEQELNKLFVEEQKAIENYIPVTKHTSYNSLASVRRAKIGFSRTSAEADTGVPMPVYSNDEQKKLSPLALLMYHIFHAVNHFDQNDFEKAFDTGLKINTLFNDYPYLPQTYPRAQYMMMILLLNCSFALKKYKGIPELLETMKKIDPPSRSLKNNIDKSILNMTVMYLVRIGDFKQALPFITANMHKKDFLNSQQHIIFYLRAASVYLGLGDYRESIKWLNKILNEFATEHRTDLMVAARLILLIIHFELNNTDLVEYYTRSTYRYLLKRQHLHEFEKVLLNYIKNEFPKVNNRKEFTVVFVSLKEKLNKVFKDPYEARALEYFDYMAWLNSKIEGKSFEEILKAESKAHASGS